MRTAMMLGPIVLATAAAAFASAQEAVTSREPTMPDEWVQTFEVRCRSERLRVAGYGARRPWPGTGPTIVSNGRSLRSEQADGLRRDLSERSAAYRLTGRCLQDGGGIIFRYVTGEITYPVEGGEGVMRYQVGSAIFRRGRIVDYRTLRPTTERTFWFR